jgi:hypothetical protein
MPARRRRCAGAIADQLMVTRGVICANQKSARSRSPASNCACEISASPSRSLRRRSHASGLSAGLTLALVCGDPASGFKLAGGMRGGLTRRGAGGPESAW